jgi:hypothetical protein
VSGAITRQALVAMVYRLKGERDALRRGIEDQKGLIARQAEMINQQRQFAAGLMTELRSLRSEFNALRDLWRRRNDIETAVKAERDPLRPLQ